METRFPFRRQLNAPDMPIDDFVRLFAPGGALDQFFAQHIRPYADTTQRPWRPVAAEGLEQPPVSQADLMQFQRAQAIRDAFFPSGVPGLGLGLRWQITPTGISAGAAGATLDNEGNRVAIPPGGGGRPIELSWPSRAPVSLTFDPAASTGPLAYEGPWASLRLVFLGRLVATPQPDRFRLTVPAGDRVAEFTLQAASSVNPFGLRELAEFRCPQLAP